MGFTHFHPLDLLVVLFIFLLLFGPKKLPELGKALGDGIRGFKEGMNPTTPAKPEEPKDQTAQAK
jgi:sec-independent protein translocase protein TatA